MSDHLKGLWLTSLGVLFIVPDSLFVRLIEADAITIAFWRCLIAGVLILLFVLSTQGAGAMRAVLGEGIKTYAYIAFFGFTTAGFVFAVALTSVANVVFILASMPVFAAIFSRIYLGEAISKRMVWTMLGVFVGLAVILWGSHETEGASWQGDLLALGVSMSFAAALTLVRSIRPRSMVPAIPITMLVVSLLLLPFADLVGFLGGQWYLFVGHGVFIAFAASLMVLGPRYISSAEVSLLILLESVFAPLLVWYVLGENPGVWALLGGAIVIMVLFVSNWVLLRSGGFRA